MLSAIAKRLFGSANDRYIKSLRRDVEAINTLEPELETLDDEALRARTFQFRERLENGETLDDIRVEAFATVREAAKRTLSQRHFDVQLIGGIVLHKGMIAEMKTGEGKTLVATLAVYLNALSGKGVHVVTVNDYLARRDSEWMGQIYRFLGLSVGCVVPGLPDAERREQYACDVTYATNNELGFDYLRDNMKYRLEDMVQREFNYAIVDEVDSILIDESRTPLIISGPAEDSSDMYRAVDKIMPKISEEHYEKDEKARSVTLTDNGTEYVEELLQAEGLIEEGSLYDIQNVGILHHVTQALRAHVLFNRDTDYIVKDDKVVIIDEFTGRMMEGRRYSEGLHQALEAKEGVTIQNENQTLASITFQNFFRLYPKLAGMTGTAVTEASEFGEIYALEVVEIPTNVPVQRIDYDDEVYRSADEKYTAIIEQIVTCQERDQPVLVGTVSIEKSELLSEMLNKRKVPHQVLNARYHEQEAFIIAQAGSPGAVTIATNMAGRGTDIQLGGNVDMRIQQEAMTLEDETARQAKTEEIQKDIEEKRARALKGGGLFVLGTERHESRRIDNQLRGRSGRQGDPGGSKFFLSLEDDLMRIFGSDRMDGMLKRLGLQEGEAIKHSWVNRALEKAQEKVEARNYETRKNLLRFDDVMNDQRKVIFEQRKDMMRADDVHDTILGMRDDVTANLVARCIPPKAYAEQWDIDTLHEECLRLFGLDLPVHDWAREEGIADEEILERIRQAIEQKMQEKEEAFGAELMRTAEKQILLSTMDKQWKEHLLALDHLRQSVGLRAYAQRNPLNEYKAEAFNHFETMLANVREEVTLLLCHVSIRVQEPESLTPKRTSQQMQESREDPAFAKNRGAGQEAAPAGGGGAAAAASGRSGAAAAAELDPDDPSTWAKTGRNASCPCGSGKKYKHCHGKLA